MSKDQRNAALDLLRRLAPSNVEDNLYTVCEMVPPLTEVLLSTVDQPLKVATDKTCGKQYLLCDYNRDGDSYRSPHSNKYDPPLDDGNVPSDKLRNLELLANDVFDSYRKAYYQGGVSSVYFWDLDDGFAGCFVVKKEGDEGVWDCIHVVDVHETDSGTSAHYKLVSTVLLQIKDRRDTPLNLSGTLTRQEEKDLPLGKATKSSNPHLSNMGGMIEDMEQRMRESLDQIYVGKTNEVVSYLHDMQGVGFTSQMQSAQQQMFGEMRRMSVGNK